MCLLWFSSYFPFLLVNGLQLCCNHWPRREPGVASASTFARTQKATRSSRLFARNRVCLFGRKVLARARTQRVLSLGGVGRQRCGRRQAGNRRAPAGARKDR